MDIHSHQVTVCKFLQHLLCRKAGKGRVKSSKSLWGKVAPASQFTSSPIHVLLCSLSSFSTLQSVSNKLSSLFLSLLWLLSCLFLHCSERLCCLLVWAISAWLLLLLHVLCCLCVCLWAPQGPGGDMLSVKWPSILPTYLSQDEATASLWKIPIPERWARTGGDQVFRLKSTLN